MVLVLTRAAMPNYGNCPCWCRRWLHTLKAHFGRYGPGYAKNASSSPQGSNATILVVIGAAEVLRRITVATGHEQPVGDREATVDPSPPERLPGEFDEEGLQHRGQ